MNEIKIGDQIWMADNLSVDTFRNGDPIPEAKSVKKWVKAAEAGLPAWCYQKNDPNGEKYGKLYNWHAVNDPRGLAPVGWHVPSDDEWTTLTDHLGGKDVAGTKMKFKIGWKNNGNGSNESGFTGLPGGHRNGSGTFFDNGFDGSWWSSTEDDTFTAWYRSLNYHNGSVDRGSSYKKNGFSVRCLRD